MALGAGYKVQAAFRIEALQTTYPTTAAESDTVAETLGGYDQIPLLSEGLVEAHEYENDNTLLGKAGVPNSDKVNIAVAGDLSCSLAYDGLTAMIYAALGFIDPRAGGTGDPEFLSPTALAEGTSTSSTWNDSSTPFVSGNVGKYIRVKDGAAEGQVRRISVFNSSSDVTITPNWTVTPAGGTAEMSDVFLHLIEPDHSLITRSFESEDNYPTGGVGVAGDTKVRRGTLAISKDVSVHEFSSVMFNGLTIEASSGQAGQITFPVIGFDLDLRTSSRNSSDSTWDFTTSPIASAAELKASIVERVIWNDLVIRIDDFSSSVSLGSGDEVKIDSLTFTMENGLTGDDRDAVSGLFAVEPARDGMRSVTLSLTMPRYEADTFLNKMKSDTIMMADIIWTGATISGSDAAKFELFIRSFKFTSVTPANVEGSGLMPLTFEAVCLIPTAAPSGMPTAIKSDSEFLIRLTNRFPFNLMRKQNEEY